ncbi:hypothetical protein Pyrfu_0350 [Pyrolobus fumarii 1A]|uniref:Uncharacterized protein n=1 Tax=Pyrolobus fumarii (strain DSM 11204 / 1A) TaxID=694429 RepID=G0EFQ1_PYRF1|nr:hypothetical protein [Pyrolobus fumarii]AEM38222.1 hypothetical protein Pyrfu_0350 [Pyrolobus fumarii 1A]
MLYELYLRTSDPKLAMIAATTLAGITLGYALGRVTGAALGGALGLLVGSAVALLLENLESEKTRTSAVTAHAQPYHWVTA